MRLLTGDGRRGARRSHERLLGRGASTLLACGRAALNGRRDRLYMGQRQGCVLWRAALVGCGHVRRSRATNDRVRMRVVFCCDVVVGAVSYTLYTAFNLGA